MNPQNPLNIAVVRNPYFGDEGLSPEQLTVSTDGGQTWSVPVEAALPPGFCTDPVNPQNCHTSGNPSVAFDSDERLYWTYLARNFDPSDPEIEDDPDLTDYDIIVMEVNPTTGLQIGDSVQVLNNPTMRPDKQWLAADSSSSSPYANRLYMICKILETPPDPAPSMTYNAVSYTDNLTAGWSTPTAISPTDNSEGVLKTSHIAVGPGGVVYAAYHSQTGQAPPYCNSDGLTGQIIVRRSTDGGETWPLELRSVAYEPGDADITWNIQNCAGDIPQTRFLNIGSTQPWIVPDPLTPGRVYVVAADDPNNVHGDLDDSHIYIIRSDDFGATWDALGPSPQPIEPSPPEDTFQVFPTASIDPVTGDLVVLWYDNRDAGTFPDPIDPPWPGGLFYLNVWFSISTDQGQNFSAPRQINDLPFDHMRGALSYAGTGTYRMGEYIGVALTTNTASGNQDLYAVWTGNTVDAQQIIFGKAVNPGDECPWDLDDSGSVEAFDLAVLLGSWGTDPSGPPDFSCDGNVNAFDLAQLLGRWGPCP